MNGYTNGYCQMIVNVVPFGFQACEEMNSCILCPSKKNISLVYANVFIVIILEFFAYIPLRFCRICK